MFGRALAWDPRSHVSRASYGAHLTLWRRTHSGAKRPRNELPDKNAPLPEAATAEP